MQVTFRALSTKKLQLLPTNNVVLVERYVDDFVQKLKDTVQPYPPVPPPPNRYKRTFKLRDSWEIHKLFSTRDIGVQLINRTRYAKWVQGPEQRVYHGEHGWKKLSDYERRADYVSGLRKLYSQFRVG